MGKEIFEYFESNYYSLKKDREVAFRDRSNTIFESLSPPKFKNLEETFETYCRFRRDSIDELAEGFLGLVDEIVEISGLGISEIEDGLFSVWVEDLFDENSFISRWDNFYEGIRRSLAAYGSESRLDDIRKDLIYSLFVVDVKNSCRAGKSYINNYLRRVELKTFYGRLS